MAQSKIFSASPGIQSALMKKGSAFGSRVGSSFYRVYGGQHENLPPGVVFWAPLTSNTKEIGGSVDTFSRASEGMYEDASQSPATRWRIAGEDVPRFENGRILMEYTISNSPVTFNANPASNVGWDESSTKSVVVDQASVDANGLAAILGDGELLFHQAIGADRISRIMSPFFGTGPYSWSMWADTFGDTITAAFETDTSTTFSASGFQRVGFRLDRVAVGSRRALFELNDTEEIKFILIQIERARAYSSPIITRGSAENRFADFLSWNVPDFPQAEGSLLIEHNPLYDQDILLTAGQNGVTFLPQLGGILYIVQDGYRTWDGINFTTAPTATFSRDEVLRVCVLWGPGSSLQIGRKYSGTWAWSPVVGYRGAWPTDDNIRLSYDVDTPARWRDLIIYDENKGTAWVEANY